jgi:F-box interacting protein
MSSDRFWQHDKVHVFTLGEASWWDVYTEIDVKCNPTRIDGMVYWLTEDTMKIMLFDLKHEHVMHNERLPVPTMPNTYHLVKVHGRMGVAIYDDDSVTVWVPDGENWSFWYVMEAHKPRQYEKWMMR